MPTKTSKTRRKTSPRRYASNARRAPAKKSPSRKSAPGRTKSTSSRPVSGRSSTSGSASRRRASQPSLSARLAGFLSSLRKPKPASARSSAAPIRPSEPGMSLDRKLDIVGICLLFVGLATLLILLSTSHNAVTSGWLNFLGHAFGWGAYLFPVGLMGIGLWLVLRYFQSIPHIALERVFGLGLLYLNLLTWLHFFYFPQDAYAVASTGGGGGYVGGFFFKLLVDNLGWGGAAIALLAWLLIALTLTLDVSVIDLFRWLPPLALRLQDGLQDWLDERRNHRPAFPASGAALSDQSAQGSAVPPLGQTGIASGPSQPATPGQTRPWALPAVEDILDKGSDVTTDDELDRRQARVIEETLAAFGAPVNVVEINRGPTITQFGVEPDFIETRTGRMRVRVGKIASLADDLALALSARTIRVEAPVPGKGYVGIEVPNEEISLVSLRDVVESEAFRRLKSPLRFALGQDVAGNAVAADLAAMPHLLVAGATGSGKSVCVNSLICCLMLHNTPDDLRLIMVDPKRVELTGYNGIPHLLAPVVVEMERVVGALQWVLREMDMRYHKLAELGTRNITEYNAKMVAANGKKLPRLVVFIDELADLMMLVPDETERTITRLAQLARATGIHLVIATQRPSVEVVTGVIKANFPSRIAFAVASGVDSRVILDQPGAERLLGRGDMLFQAPDAAAPIRLQGTFVSDVEIQRLVSYWQSFNASAPPAPAAAGIPIEGLPAGVPLKQMPLFEAMQPQEDTDPLLAEAINLSRRQGRSSISMLQRRLRIGYTRSARLVETMQEKGIISAEAGPQGFEILDYGPAAPPAEKEAA